MKISPSFSRGMARRGDVVDIGIPTDFNLKVRLCQVVDSADMISIA